MKFCDNGGGSGGDDGVGHGAEITMTMTATI